MLSAKKSSNGMVLFFSVLAVLCFWPASTSASEYSVDTAAGLPAPDHAEKAYVVYRGLPTFEEEAGMTEAVPAEPRVQADAAGAAAVPSPGTYVKEFFPDILGGTERIFSRDNLPITLIGVGLTGLALTVDQRVKKYFQDRKPLEHVENTGDKIGSGYPEVGVGLALLGTGELIKDKKLADTGAVSLEAYVIDGIATEGLKLTARRKRPNGGNLNSFPSGHASITATMAASISEMYDWDLRIAVPLYLTTAFVGASRIQANEHFLSDVIAGITVGTLAGMSVAKYHKEKDAHGGLQNITIAPVYDGDVRGCVFTLRFL
jgi:hypothetical protein